MIFNVNIIENDLNGDLSFGEKSILDCGKFLKANDQESVGKQFRIKLLSACFLR